MLLLSFQMSSIVHEMEDLFRPSLNGRTVMKNGALILLDQMSLAEDAVLERAVSYRYFDCGLWSTAHFRARA